MKVISKHTDILQDKVDPKVFYEPKKEYDVDDKTGERLIKSGKFEEVKSTKKENKEGKESAK